MYFLITGRVQSTLHDSLGKEVQKDTIVPGRAIALIALGSSDRSLLHVEAIEPSTAIKLTPKQLLQLAAEHPDLQLALFRLVVNAFKRYVMVDRSLPKPSVVGIIHHSEASRSLVGSIGTSTSRVGRVSRQLSATTSNGSQTEISPLNCLLAEGQMIRQDLLKDWSLNQPTSDRCSCGPFT